MGVTHTHRHSDSAEDICTWGALGCWELPWIPDRGRRPGARAPHAPDGGRWLAGRLPARGAAVLVSQGFWEENHHKLGGEKHQDFAASRLWWPEVQSQGVGGAVPSGGSGWCLSPSSGGSRPFQLADVPFQSLLGPHMASVASSSVPCKDACHWIQGSL